MPLSGTKDKSELSKVLEARCDEISFEDLRVVRDWLRDCDPIADWPLEERLPRIRARVMKEIMAADKAGLEPE